ncbi:MAG TPA: hypothetical protein VMF31_03855 [Solirubrobacterales bacterium]|nr:hypothetical protein [Solirubrobacterales bacterium]
MKRLVILLLSMVAVGAIGAGQASAATGFGSSTVMIKNQPCTTTFVWDTGSGNPDPPTGSPVTLSNFFLSGCPYSLVEPPTTLTITFGSGGTVTWNGTVRINTAGIVCNYPVSGLAGTHSGTDPINVIGGGLAYRASGSNFLCPSEIEFDFDVYLFLAD